MGAILSTPNADSMTIKTLDGEEHDWESLIEKMDDDDFYYGHLGKVALSSSIIKTILKSPKEYLRYLNQAGDEDSQPLRDGKLFHWRVLEPHKFDNLHVIDVSSKNTKAFKEAVAEHGSSVFTQKEVDNAINLAEVMTRNQEIADYLDGSEFEVPQIQMIDGIPIRGKADILKGNEIIDLKTTADLRGFMYSARKFGYDLQAYLYLQLFPECDTFTFICIDKKTQDLGIYSCSEEFLASGKEKLERGISLFKKYFTDDEDPEETLAQMVYHGTL
jgi:hypothetical protein|tara:strand:+ start:1428 stop:2249 length:822 start_codon:yes stop_codon:yes gene_type:complete